MRVRDVAHQKPDDLHVNVGAFDPALGRSCFEVAMQGRSLHRSQNMGALPLKGPQSVVYRVAAGAPLAGGRNADPLGGLPQRLDAWAQAYVDECPDAGAALGTAVRHLDEAWERYHPQRPEKTVPSLAAALGDLVQAARAPDGAPPALLGRLRECRRRVESAWLQAHGLVLDVLAAQPEVVAGGRVEVEAELFLRGNADVVAVVPAGEVPARAGGWSALTARHGRSRYGGAPVSWRDSVSRRRRTRPARWLPPCRRGCACRPRAICTVSSRRSRAWRRRQRRRLWVQAKVNSGNPAPGCGRQPDITLSAPVMWRELDPTRGEVRQPLRVRPAVTLSVSPRLIVLPASGAASPTIDVQLHARAARQGRLILRDCSDLREVHGSALGLRAGEQRTLRQTLPAGSGASGRRVYGVEYRGGGAEEGEAGYASRLKSWQEVRYPHVEPAYVLAPAEACVSVVAAEVPSGLRVGYLPGTGDGVAEALGELGVSFRILEEDDLQNGRLAEFESVVVGVRALETRPSLAAQRGRLWDYARAGGTVVVQYHKPREDGPGRFVPFDGVSLPRPAPRVSQAAAPVRLLAADDPILSFPNRLGAEDFAGWQQERGLYFLAAWPPDMTPLLESADPGEEPRRGGLMRARLGLGHYVYCAYALFRQLPAGVPGAYRLLANLISLPRAPGAVLTRDCSTRPSHTLPRRS